MKHHARTFPSEWIPCSINTEMMTNTEQTAATAHVGVSSKLLSAVAPPPAMLINLLSNNQLIL